jgi:hypothetical protein
LQRRACPSYDIFRQWPIDRLEDKGRSEASKVTYNRKNTALSSDTSLGAAGIELFEGLRCIGGYRDWSANLITHSTAEVLLDQSRTVLAADGGKVEDVELATLSNSAGAEGRVGLGLSNRGACGEGEDGGGELHVD